jgi:hypothetical protein
MPYAEVRERFKARAIGAVVDKNANCLSTLCRGNRFGREPTIHETPVDFTSLGSALQRFTIVRLGIKNNSRYHATAV